MRRAVRAERPRRRSEVSPNNPPGWSGSSARPRAPTCRAVLAVQLTIAALALLAGGSAVGFWLARQRASRLSAASGGRGVLHSLPSYHGLLAATAIAVPMLAVYAIAMPLLGRYVESRALSFLAPEIAVDHLKRSVALRDIYNARSGMQPASEAVRQGAESMSALLQAGHWLIFAAFIYGVAKGNDSCGESFPAACHSCVVNPFGEKDYALCSEGFNYDILGSHPLRFLLITRSMRQEDL